MKIWTEEMESVNALFKKMEDKEKEWSEEDKKTRIKRSKEIAEMEEELVKLLWIPCVKGYKTKYLQIISEKRLAHGSRL